MGVYRQGPPAERGDDFGQGPDVIGDAYLHRRGDAEHLSEGPSPVGGTLVQAALRVVLKGGSEGAAGPVAPQARRGQAQGKSTDGPGIRGPRAVTGHRAS